MSRFLTRKRMTAQQAKEQEKENKSAAVAGTTPAKPKPISAFARSLASNIASWTSVTVCFPLEVIKTRMQIQGGLGESGHGLSSMGTIF
jgi:hypothetical protein